jgi:hypothetical protein
MTYNDAQEVHLGNYDFNALGLGLMAFGHHFQLYHDYILLGEESPKQM